MRLILTSDSSASISFSGSYNMVYSVKVHSGYWNLLYICNCVTYFRGWNPVDRWSIFAPNCIFLARSSCAVWLPIYRTRTGCVFYPIPSPTNSSIDKKGRHSAPGRSDGQTGSCTTDSGNGPFGRTASQGDQPLPKCRLRKHLLGLCMPTQILEYLL